MKRSLPSLYAEYGRYIDQFRAIPYYLDVLKPVERRLLLALWDVAKNKTVKSAKIIGEVIAKYHPHGDQSAYETLVSLVQRNLAFGQGNWGHIGYEKTDQAAYRYTETQASQFVTKFCFEFINYIDWYDPENLSEQQPVFLPSPIPIGLIGEGLIYGISFNTTKIPRYSLDDLIERLIGINQKISDPTIYPKTIIPQFKNCDVYEAQPGEFEKILTFGEGIIKVIPKFQVKSDGIYIYGRPPSGFTSLKNDEKKLEDENKSFYKIIDLSAKDKIEVFIHPISSKFFDQKFVDHIFKLVTSSINISCKFVEDDGHVYQKSIDNILQNCYLKWISVYGTKLNSDKTKLEEKIFELKIVSIIKEIISSNSIKSMSDLINIFKTNYSTKYPECNETILKEVSSKHKISKLLEYNVDLSSLNTELINVNSLLIDVNSSAFIKFQNLYNSLK